MTWTSPSGAVYTTYPSSWSVPPPDRGEEPDDPDDLTHPDDLTCPDQVTYPDDATCPDDPRGHLDDDPDGAPTSSEECSGVPWDIGVRWDQHDARAQGVPPPDPAG